MTDLERALSDLADHLDAPEAGNWRDRLAYGLTAGAGPHRRSPRLLLVAAAAAIVVASAGVVAIAPARHAVAGWLGIGAVEIRRSEPRVLPTSSTTPTRAATTSTRPPIAPLDIAAAQKEVQFDIVTPHDEGAPSKVAVDHRVPGGLVVLTYSHFTLVEIATDKTQTMPLAKLVGGTRIELVTVHGRDGMWIGEVHRIGYLDRNGQFQQDTLRRSGPVLLWERDGVTYRVEGPHTLAEAMTIAESIV